MTTIEPPETLSDLLEQLPEDLARQSLTHASWVSDRTESYQRLAFLGDVVLSLAISDHLFPRLPTSGAGRLTKVRAQTVSGAACAEVARDLGIPARLTREAEARSVSGFESLLGSERVLASICEAVIGAAYLAFGFERVAPAVVEAFGEQLDAALSTPVDHKSLLQERLAQRAEVVSYAILEESGPAHDRRFLAVASVNGEEIGRGEGRTKKGAEQEAASAALDEMESP